MILVGHAGHPEVLGTMGQLPEGAVLLVEEIEDVATIKVNDPDNLAYCTQTTLSVDDTADIVDALQQRFPNITGPSKEDICYATTNRQSAVKHISEQCDAMLVIGAPNSSNSNRLVEVARLYGCPRAFLVQRAAEINWDDLSDIQTLGITAGASAPEVLVHEVIDAAKQHFTVEVEQHPITQEDVVFNLPKVLREDTAA